MAPQTKQMTSGSPLRLLVSFALPLMLGNIFQQLYTVVDTAVVGKALGVGALAAIGAADWLYWLMLGTVQGLTQGFAILMAQEFGAQRLDKLRKAVGGAITLSAVGAVLLVLLSEMMARPVLLLMQTPAEILGSSLLYLRVMFAGLPVLMAYNLLAAILRSLGDSKTPLFAMIVASFLNIALDLLFVLVFHWGIAGAAAASLIAQLISGVYCLLRVMRIDVLHLAADDFRPTGRLTGKLLSLGFPMAFQNTVIAVGGMIVQLVVNRCGVLFIAGMTATNKLYGVLEVAATSYGYAMTTYVGQNLGAGKISRIRRGVRTANLLALVTSMAISAALLLLGKKILLLFLSGTPQEIAGALDVAYRYLSVMSICLPILYFLHIIRSAIQGTGNTVLPMLSGVAEFIMRTAAAILLPMMFGEESIMFAEVIAWAGADVVLSISYLVTMRQISCTDLS